MVTVTDVLDLVGVVGNATDNANGDNLNGNNIVLNDLFDSSSR